MTWQVINGDCVEAMAAMDEASVDAIVCDPPYGLEFMGKDWDRLDAGADVRQPGDPTFHRSGAGPFDRAKVRHGYDTPIAAMQQWHHAWATEAFRILKPGGHLLASSGSRTYHRLACAVEDAGFEIRDSLIWLYGSGFPKGVNVAKAIDKAAGVEPKVVGKAKGAGSKKTQALGEFEDEYDDTVPVTPEAQQWAGWNTALKPAHEPIVMARKPFDGNTVANVLANGTGAINVDACRVEGDKGDGNWTGRDVSGTSPFIADQAVEGGKGDAHPAGRRPANVVTDEAGAAAIDEQSGDLVSGPNPAQRGSAKFDTAYGEFEGGEEVPARGTDRGGASRFFYCAKSSPAERNAGLDDFEDKIAGGMSGRQDGSLGHDVVAKNVHPTVKPIDLMRWLCRLVTPLAAPCTNCAGEGYVAKGSGQAKCQVCAGGGTVPGLIVDPFTGSGTTGIAAVLEGFDFVGVEREDEYVPYAKARIKWWERAAKNVGHVAPTTEAILAKAGLSEKEQAFQEYAGQLGLEMGEAA